MTISDTQRQATEARIRAAADRLLAGTLPTGGKCDIKTLAVEANVSRAALYRTYPHLKREFEQRLARLRTDGHQPDPREARLLRLTEENRNLRARAAELTEQVTRLTTFETTAISQLAALRAELIRLRDRAGRPDNVVALHPGSAPDRKTH